MAEPTLKDAAKEMLTAGTNKENPNPNVAKLNHPTLDSVNSGQRTTYNPPPPEKRFGYLKDYATVPGLRAKGKALAAQQ